MLQSFIEVIGRELTVYALDPAFLTPALAGPLPVAVIGLVLENPTHNTMATGTRKRNRGTGSTPQPLPAWLGAITFKHLQPIRIRG